MTVKGIECVCDNSMSSQHSNVQNTRNWFEARELSYVITVRAAEETVMLSSIYKIFVRSCSTPTNHSHESPLGLKVRKLRELDFLVEQSVI